MTSVSGKHTRTEVCIRCNHKGQRHTAMGDCSVRHCLCMGYESEGEWWNMTFSPEPVEPVDLEEYEQKLCYCSHLDREHNEEGECTVQDCPCPGYEYAGEWWDG